MHQTKRAQSTIRVQNPHNDIHVDGSSKRDKSTGHAKSKARTGSKHQNANTIVAEAISSSRNPRHQALTSVNKDPQHLLSNTHSEERVLSTNLAIGGSVGPGGQIRRVKMRQVPSGANATQRVQSQAKER